MTTCKLMHDPVKVKERVEAEDGRWAIAFARIEWYVVKLSLTLIAFSLYVACRLLMCYSVRVLVHFYESPCEQI